MIRTAIPPASSTFFAFFTNMHWPRLASATFPRTASALSRGWQAWNGEASTTTPSICNEFQSKAKRLSTNHVKATNRDLVFDRMSELRRRTTDRERAHVGVAHKLDVEGGDGHVLAVLGELDHFLYKQRSFLYEKQKNLRSYFKQSCFFKPNSKLKK